MFKVPIDYQCAIFVFRTPPQCEQLPTNVRETARRRPAHEDGRLILGYPFDFLTTNESAESLFIGCMPDPEISQIFDHGHGACQIVRFCRVAWKLG